MPSELSDAEKAAFASLDAFYKKGTSYSAMMSTRPQTLGYGLADSPAVLAAFYDDKFAARTYSGGEPERALTRDEMLDDITLYWFTNTGTSSSRLYWENKDNVFNAVDISIPVGVTVFPGEIYRAPRSWAEHTYHKLIYWNEVEKGGHFAAWEQPNSSPPRSKRRSDHCAKWREVDGGHNVCPYSPTTRGNIDVAINLV